MRKTIAALLIGIFCLTGCARGTSSGEMERFFIVESYMNFRIICDRYTGVMYTESDATYNRGDITLLVDADGKPLLYNGWGILGRNNEN